MLCPVFAAASEYWMAVGRRLVASCFRFTVALMKLSVVSLFIVIPVNANFLAQDRMEIRKKTSVAAWRNICCSWVGLERSARYLLDPPRILWTFKVDEDGHHDAMDVFAPSVPAGCSEHA